MAQVTITDVASKVGLSKTTVGYVLSGKSDRVKIARSTVERIRNTAKELGYRPNRWASSLASNRTRTIGVVFPDLTGASAHEITEGIKDVLGQNNYDEMIGVSFWNPEEERKEIELLLEKQVEGIIALPLAESDTVYHQVEKEGCPLVFVSDYLPGCNVSSVTLDPADSVIKMVNHLRQLGHSRMAMISVDYGSATLREREEAFLSGLERLGFRDADQCLFRTGLCDDIAVYETVRQVLSQGTNPTALVCISDPVAFLVLAELARLKVRVPEELAIVSIGNLAMSEHPFFALTTVDECRREMGREAARLILKHIEEKENQLDRHAEHVRLKGSLFTRHTSISGNALRF